MDSGHEKKCYEKDQKITCMLWRAKKSKECISSEVTIFSRWFSVGICKYKPGYKSHDLLSIRVLSLVEITAFRLESKSCKGFFLNKFSTNESTRIITGHVIYNTAYTYKFQLKTTQDKWKPSFIDWWIKQGWSWEENLFIWYDNLNLVNTVRAPS